MKSSCLDGEILLLSGFLFQPSGVSLMTVTQKLKLLYVLETITHPLMILMIFMTNKQ